MRKFEYKYKIDEKKRTIVAMSTFAGKVIAGVARCAPTDEFDIETGKKIAAARCSVKVAEKRMKRANYCMADATAGLAWFQKRFEQMRKYQDDSVSAYQAAVVALAEVEKNI